jgi:hypothetical protein
MHHHCGSPLVAGDPIMGILGQSCAARDRSFLMQFTVQGAWGVVPVHLNELSPDTARGTFPGFVYQLGNLLASVNATLQAGIASHFGGNYGLALAAVAGSVAIIIAVLTAVGTEAKGIARRRKLSCRRQQRLPTEPPIECYGA